MVFKGPGHGYEGWKFRVSISEVTGLRHISHTNSTHKSVIKNLKCQFINIIKTNSSWVDLDTQCSSEGCLIDLELETYCLT